jgi:hypothetical protein
MFGRKKDHPRAKTPRKSTADQHRIGSNVPTDRKLRAKPNTGNIRFLASGRAHGRSLYGKGISNPDDLK